MTIKLLFKDIFKLVRDKTQIVLLLNRIEKIVESYEIIILQSNVVQINLITKKLIYFENLKILCFFMNIDKGKAIQPELITHIHGKTAGC